MFEMKRRDGLARIGTFDTQHGKIETPALLPVFNPLKIVVTPQRLREMGGTALITNAYIIMRSQKLRKSFQKHGLHRMLNFDGPIMTDSGTFQSHVYGDIDVKPEVILNFQAKIGSDIATILDLFTEPDASREEAEERVNETLARARTASGLKTDMAISAPVQGSVFNDLRASCARSYYDMDVQVHPIGGIVPLMESYRYTELVDVVLSSKMNLPPERPVHLFGAGHPMMFSLAVLMGADMFDSAAYAKYAIDERMVFPWGTRHLEDLSFVPCSCPICKVRTPEDIRSMPQTERRASIAEHNLWVSFQEVREIRQAIKEESIWELAERRAASHPLLMAAYRRLLDWSEKLAKWEPLSRRREFVITPWDVKKPCFVRYRKRLRERVVLNGEWDTIQLPSGGPQEYKGEGDRLLFHHPVGFIPNSLDLIYPVGLLLTAGELPLWRSTPGKSVSMGDGEPEHDRNMRRVHTVLAYQFGPGAANALCDGDLKVSTSRRTGRIRNIYCEDVHILAMRNDGFFTLKPHGASLIISKDPRPPMRVIVNDDSAEFNVMGRNVFSRFVLEVGEEVGLKDEVIVMDQTGEAVAVGRALMTGEEMGRFKTGIAVKVREGMLSPDPDAPLENQDN